MGKQGRAQEWCVRGGGRLSRPGMWGKPMSSVGFRGPTKAPNSIDRAFD